MTQLTQHFKLSELRCRCGCPLSDQVLERLKKMAEALEVARGHLGKPIEVISGYRCEGHNKRVGGRPRSQHLQGNAVDIRVEKMTGVQLRAIFERLIWQGHIPQGGLGTYADRPKTLHYDLRGHRARWSEG